MAESAPPLLLPPRVLGLIIGVLTSSDEVSTPIMMNPENTDAWSGQVRVSSDEPAVGTSGPAEADALVERAVLKY